MYKVILLSTKQASAIELFFTSKVSLHEFMDAIEESENHAEFEMSIIIIDDPF